MHTYSLTYGQSVMICFYMMGLGANFTIREVASSANNYANCDYDLSGHIQYLRHTVSISNRFSWLYIYCSQSPWFGCVTIESSIFPWWASRVGGGVVSCKCLKKEAYQEGRGMKKERGGGADTPLRTMISDTS